MKKRILFLLLFVFFSQQSEAQVDTIKLFIVCQPYRVQSEGQSAYLSLEIKDECIEAVNIPKLPGTKNGYLTSVHVLLANKSDAQKSISLAVTGENIRGSTADSIVVPSEKSHLCTLDFVSLNVYDFILNITVSSGSLNTLINIKCPAKVAYPIFGTIEHFSRRPPGREAAEKDMAVLKYLPCQVFRVDGPGTWAFQGNPDYYDWGEADWQVARIKKLGARIVMLCGYIPGWVKFNPHDYTKEELKIFLAHYQKYMAALVRRYSREVDYWEIWNEPELFWFSNKVGSKETEVLYRIIKIANSVIRKEDPTAMILTPGFTPDVINCSGPGFALFDSLQRRGMVDLVDVVCVHNYPGAYPPAYNKATGATGLLDWLKDFENRADMGKLKRYLREKGISKPIWFTECGLPYDWGADREAALGFARMLAINAFDGVQGFIQYETYDYPHDAHPPDFALVRSSNGQKSSMFDCYQVLVQALTGAIPAPGAVEYQDNQDQKALKYRTFTRNGELMLVFWNNSLRPKVMKLSSKYSAKRVSLTLLSVQKDKDFIEQMEFNDKKNELPYIRLEAGGYGIMIVDYLNSQ